VDKINSVFFICTVIFQTLSKLSTIIAVAFNLCLFLFDFECKCSYDVHILCGVFSAFCCSAINEIVQ